MANPHWTIEKSTNDERFFRPFKLTIEPSFPCTGFFFEFLDAKRLLAFLRSIVNSQGYHNQSFAAVYYPDDMDGMDIANGLAIPQGFLRIFDELAEKTELIDERLFYRITIDYAESMIEFYRNSSEFGDSWREGILANITKIKHRLNAMPEL